MCAVQRAQATKPGGGSDAWKAAGDFAAATGDLLTPPAADPGLELAGEDRGLPAPLPPEPSATCDVWHSTQSLALASFMSVHTLHCHCSCLTRRDASGRAVSHMMQKLKAVSAF